jgi:hypothetical protein
MAMITIDLTPNGAPPKVEANGISGRGCSALTRIFEQALGGETVEDLKKPEYHDEQQAGQDAGW